jgi:hypothetical protein
MTIKEQLDLIDECRLALYKILDNVIMQNDPFDKHLLPLLGMLQVAEWKLMKKRAEEGVVIEDES